MLEYMRISEGESLKHVQNNLAVPFILLSLHLQMVPELWEGATIVAVATKEALTEFRV